MIIIFILPNIRRISRKPFPIPVHKRETDLKRLYTTYRIVGYSCLLVGLLSTIIISVSLGGIVELIKLSEKARSYGKGAEPYIESGLLPFRALMILVLASPFLFLIVKRIRKNLINSILFYVSMIASSIFLLINAGRIVIFTFFIPFFLNHLLKSRHRLLYLTLLCFFILFLLPISDDLFFYISYGFFKEPNHGLNPLQYFIEQFGYPYANLLNAGCLRENIGFRYGVDLILWILNIVPVSILNSFGLWKILNINDHVSLFYSMTGDVSKIISGVPTDIITFGYLQLGIVGTVCIIFFFSLFIKYLDKMMYSDSHYLIKEEMYLRMILISGFFVSNACLDSIIRGRADFIIFFVLTLLGYKCAKLKVRTI